MNGAGTFRNQVGGQVGRDFTTKFSEATGYATIAGAAGPPATDHGNALDIGDGGRFALMSVAACRGGEFCADRFHLDLSCSPSWR
jgi:hypothetical protein